MSSFVHLLAGAEIFMESHAIPVDRDTLAPCVLMFSVPMVSTVGDKRKNLTLKHRETHGCVVSTVATDALVLKHQAISILSTD